MRSCGREFTDEELELIRQLITEEPKRNRAQLSRVVCERLGCCQACGGFQQMSRRVAMLRLHEDG